jgi:hypothetical protein
VINQNIADKLREVADLLEQQDANPFFVNAYRRVANTIAMHPEDVTTLFEREGLDGLMALPGLARSIASAIQQIVRTGRWPQLERLPGMGTQASMPGLAARNSTKPRPWSRAMLSRVSPSSTTWLVTLPIKSPPSPAAAGPSRPRRVTMGANIRIIGVQLRTRLRRDRSAWPIELGSDFKEQSRGRALT